jgi:transposase
MGRADFCPPYWTVGRRWRREGCRDEVQAQPAAAARAGERDGCPAASGWDEDECWMRARIAEVIRARFRVNYYSLVEVDLLLHRFVLSVQVHARQAADREEARLTAWREGT